MIVYKSKGPQDKQALRGLALMEALEIALHKGPAKWPDKPFELLFLLLADQENGNLVTPVEVLESLYERAYVSKRAIRRAIRVIVAEENPE